MKNRSGESLLHFRLAEKIGEGGMGEVWKAVDTTLDREVAIKFLPEALAGDRERIARLEREAKLLASLNHPNIAAIYGFPEADEAGGGKVRFLAMELVRGEDLEQVLAHGPMPVREAIEAAKQIAAALEAAHESGVIHRDLKPANIKRTPGGQIKVLDFGLAKAFEPGGTSSGKSMTVTSAGSTAGLIVGTASYMSPEQARGQLVDRRTDLWAFGCVLYEMLTGAKAFGGATVTDVLAAVVTGEPNWGKLPAATPPTVRRLLRRCLEKDQRKRLRDAGDAGLLLDDNPEDTKPPAAQPAASKRSTLFAAVAIVVALASLTAGWLLAGRGGASAGGAAGSIEFHRVTYARGMLRSARFAADGRTIVYGAAWGGPPIKLHMARIESPESAPIPLPPAELLSISKSGEMAIALDYAFYGWMADGTLARSSLLGGAPREILPNVRSADWSPDESQFAVVHRVEGQDLLEYPIGKVLDKTIGYFADVRISPDGERVAYADHPSWGDNRGGISVVDRSGAKTQLVTDFAAIQGLAWAPGGKEVWYTGTKGDQGSLLYAADLAGRSRVVYASIGSIELFDIAADGRVLLGSQKPEREVLALLAGYTEPRSLYVSGEASMSRGITADGSTILVSSHDTKDYETFVVRADRPGAVKLTSGDGAGISPDRTLAMTSSANYRELFLSPLGMGPTRTIPNPDRIEYESLAAWLPDGKRFVITGRRDGKPSQAFVCDLETGAGKPFGEPGVMWPIFTGPPISPDGKFAVLQDAGGITKRWPIEGGEPIVIPGLRREDQPLTYTDDGKALFVAGLSMPIQIERLDLASGKRSPWVTVAPTDRAGLRYAVATISPNGKYWAMSTAKLLTDLYVVEGLR